MDWVGIKLLDLALGADLFQLSLDSLGVLLGDALLQSLGSSLDSSLGLSQAQTGQLANDLDDLDLLGADLRQDDVELVLLLNGSSSSSASGGSSHSSGGNAELFLQSVDQLGQLQNSQTLDLFEQGSDLLRHCNCLLKVNF